MTAWRILGAPGSLSRRFALAAAVLTACAVLLIAAVSSWLIDRQRAQANVLLQQREVAFQAATVSRNLSAITARLAEVAGNPLLATALVDSAGKETYVVPFLHGLRQLNGVPLQLLFTDFEGAEIASNGAGGFTPADIDWLRTRLDSGLESATLRSGPYGDELLGVSLLRYSRTRTPEGALLFKVRLADLRPAPGAVLERAGSAATNNPHDLVVPVALAAPLAGLPLQMREDVRRLVVPIETPATQYLTIASVACALALLVFLLASRLAFGLTRDLRGLETFSQSLGDDGVKGRRAPLGGSREVSNLARALNGMLDRLTQQHERLEEERRKFLQLANNIPQLVWTAEPDGTLVWFNDRWHEFAGTKPGTVTEDDWRSRHDPDLLPQVLRHWQDALKSGNLAQMTFPLRGADGRYRSFFTSVAPLRDAAGNIVQWFGTCTDVTALERAERALRYSEERLQQGLVAARMAVWERDPDSGRVNFSANLHSVFGKTWKNAAEMWELVDPEDAPALRAAVDVALADPRADAEYGGTARIRRADDGRLAWVDIRGRVGLGADGRSTVMHAVAIDVTERKRAEEALQLADRRKDEFLAMLAHELRNPLAPISSAADMLRIAFAHEPRIKQISDIIGRQVGHMRHLVDDLLDVSRVTRGLVVLTRTRLDLRAVVQDAVEQSRPLVDARRHDLSVSTGDVTLWVDGDRTRLVQVATNLLVNAAKYTPDGGRIEVDLRAADKEAVLAVRDNGTGIAPDLLPAVFDLFTQGSRTLDRTQGGLGLGLALVRKLVELHGGRVAAHSDGPGRGSVFTVTLPLADGQAAD